MVNVVQKISVMTKFQKVAYFGIFFVWIVAAIFFWRWWIQPLHFGNPILFWGTSFAFFYDGTFLPFIFLYYLGKMKRPVEIPAHEAKGVVKKVALITLTVPGVEDIKIVERQLKAMASVTYPHHCWLLVDKMHSEELKKLALKYRVNYFSRHDEKKWGPKKIAYWNQAIPPFKAKTKAGNVNAWIDAYGTLYSHFTQFDIDHTPRKDYLDRVLGYFKDKSIAWVQAPSVYGNLDKWTAKGAAEQELVLQGPLQMGFYGTTSIPFIIGSHATYSMAAIKKIGGFQPTRAEDHLDTLYLAMKGYKGVFVPDIIAVGDGPETFDTYLSQQFAWAYSLMQVLTKHTPRAIWKLKPTVALQFLFTQTWYPVWALSMLFLFLTPAFSLLFNAHIAQTNFFDFVFHSAPISIMSFLAWAWSRKWHNPKTVFLSWRGIALHIARWFIVVSAVTQAVLNISKPYMITKKGGKEYFSLDAVFPYILLASFMLLVSSWYYVYSGVSKTQGYLFFSLENALIMFFIAFLPVVIAVKQKVASVREIVSDNKAKVAFSFLGFTLFTQMSFKSAPLIQEAFLPTPKMNIAASVEYKPYEEARVESLHIAPDKIIVHAKAGDSIWSLSDQALNEYLAKYPRTVKNHNGVIAQLSNANYRHVSPGDQVDFSVSELEATLNSLSK